MTLEQIHTSVSSIRSKVDNFQPEVAIVLGSGLGGLTDGISIVAEVDYRDIEHFPVSTVEGHKGHMIFGILGGRKVVAMQGRFHYYEGYTPQQVVLGVRAMALLGAQTLFVSNAAGGINPSFEIGDLMAITDHINLIPNPLIGPNIAELGTRFPSMDEAYDSALIATAMRLDPALKQGIYVGGTGPTFETPAEYRYFRAIGGDAVGMSTTPEVIAARHIGMRVFGVSVITNCGLTDAKSTHEEVQIAAAKAAERMEQLFVNMIKNL